MGRPALLDACQSDFDVIIVRECVASKDAHHHDLTMAYLDGGVARLATLDDLQEHVLPGRVG